MTTPDRRAGTARLTTNITAGLRLGTAAWGDTMALDMAATSAATVDRPLAIAEAITLIGVVPGYGKTADDLRRARIRYDPQLPDRGRVSLRGVIVLGPEPFGGTAEMARVGLAGTLVHEHWHTRQNPFQKTWSFWAGVFTDTPLMRRYEWPAYRRQAGFLKALAAARPALRPVALREREAALASFAALYNA